MIRAELRLRAVEPEDLELLYRIENDPDLWEVSRATGPYSRYQLKQYITQNQNDFFVDHQLRLMIEVSGVEGPVGMLDFCDYSPLNRRAEVGIVIDAVHRAKGIGLRTLRWAEHHAFGCLGLHQLYAFVAVDNTASLRLFEAAGYERSAVLRDWVRTAAGTYTDVVLMQLVCDSARGKIMV